jgi:hypothetical protein
VFWAFRNKGVQKQENKNKSEKMNPGSSQKERGLREEGEAEKREGPRPRGTQFFF